MASDYCEIENDNAINVECKKLHTWFTSNNHILLLMDIGHELNKYLYGEESCKLLLQSKYILYFIKFALDINKWDLDDNLIKTTRQSILKCFSLLENMFSINSTISSSLTYLASK